MDNSVTGRAEKQVKNVVKQMIKRKARKSHGCPSYRGVRLSLPTAYVTADYDVFLFRLSPNKSGLEQFYVLPVVGSDVTELEGS